MRTGRETTLQMQVTNDAGGLLKRSIDKTVPVPATMSAQRAAATVVAASLSGHEDIAS